MHDNDIHFPPSHIQRITTTNIIDNTNNNLCQHKQKQQYMKHMINDSEPGVGQEQVDSITHHSLKIQTVTPHADEVPTITITNNSNNTHELNYAAIVKRNTRNYTIVGDVAKRKATSPLQCAPSNKIQKKQENNTIKSSDGLRLTSIINNNDDSDNSGSSSNMKSEKFKIEGCKVNELKLEPDTKKSWDNTNALQLVSSPSQISDTVPNSGNYLGQECNNGESEADAKPAEAPNTVATPYAEIARRNSEKKHLMYLNASGLMGIKNNSFSKFDRLEQQLGRPAVIPWVETGDPLTHLYQKETGKRIRISNGQILSTFTRVLSSKRLEECQVLFRQRSLLS
ncbi:hypothetical protein BDC45DRAFT_142495 [Circinella umbellata]|nr:hypothetical protein BDC45DRAFT_142495 [Circinella umbellata]